MSRVSSLGIHTPAALNYCITEQLLPEHPTPSDYIWTTGLPHEELLIAGSAVIWSQGNVIRRVFRYDVEKEPVVRAVLTWFPSDDPADYITPEDSDDDSDLAAGYVSGGSEGNKRKPDWGDDVKAKKRPATTWNSKTRTYAQQLGSFPKARGGTTPRPKSSVEGEAEMVQRTGRARALVVFLKTQAFVYFLSGTMHVIHLPFEVENAVAAPRGLVLQRKILTPPEEPLFGIKTNNAFTQRPSVAAKDSPKLFTLTDPLYEVGLVMNTGNAPATEDLVFISPASEFEDLDESKSKYAGTNREVIFAVTYNQERSSVTVWQVRYIPQEQPINPGRRTPSASGTASRRRSSFGPGTGATTPVHPGSISMSSVGTVAGKTGRESLGPSDAVTALSGLTDDFETTGRRSSRRVSSLVARADLSANLEAAHRFSDVASSIGPSFGGPPPPPNNSMIIDEQPVDELLNELNMGALGIGMDDMGAYDSDGLKQEVLMHKIETFNCRVSRPLNCETNSPIRVFTLRAPTSVEGATAAGRKPPARELVMFIVNRDEGVLFQLTFQVQIHSAMPKGYSRRSSTRYGSGAMGYTPILSNTQKRSDVLDAVKIQDDEVQRVLILTSDGKMFLYSPWGGMLDIVLPPTLSRWNQHVVGEDGSRRGSRKKGFAKSLSITPQAFQRFEYSEVGGRLTVVDGDNVGHRISITMAPRDIAIKNCLETLRVILGAEAGVHVGEGVLSTWMAVSKWLLATSDPEAGLTENLSSASPADEWKAFVVTLFLFAVPLLPEAKPPPRRKSAFVRSTSMVSQREWEDMVSHEGEWGSGPEYTRSLAWRWMMDEEDEKAMQPAEPPQTRTRHSVAGAQPPQRLQNQLITDCVAHARAFMKTPMAGTVQNEFLGNGEGSDVRRTGLAVSLVALHLLREEWKLDIALEGPARRLCPVLRQVATWLGWERWAEEYMLEDMEMVGWDYDNTRITNFEVPPEPFEPPDIFQWMMACLKGTSPAPFMVMQDIVAPASNAAAAQHSQNSQRPRNPFSPPPAPPPIPQQKAVFADLTPRTRIITALYTTLSTPGATDVDVVEKMVELKVTLSQLRRFPEGAGIPLREAIARCQEQPPTTWGVAALEIVGRKDLRMLIDPIKHRTEKGSKWTSAPTHEATRDVHLICNSTFDSAETVGSYDHTAEHDRQSIARLLFKDDRRLQEASKLLNTQKASLAKCMVDQASSEQEILDAYKDVAINAAMRTLATPPGRGMFYFSARIPLLTEKFPITGFNLSCVIKPSGTTVTADKTLFTEEKVCWAFFHSGVAAGISISREAKEIDTSWIVFNKPAELTNRHAGFLLGLGLNGHLKNIAKWHAFNYLTPKHPMISIGLLLGLSASYLGTMDTTITKLLSIHVTRLLPPGSVELNVSPLMQTAGIMGIGLLYAQSQHRRMSEVMLSEIEYVEEQDSCVPTDTLRDEGYRLAAGFALGFINLGSGKDLRGLHDMNLVERLQGLAVGSKKVSVVHILDKATAGATIALALIYMKTNDEVLARKLDVPDTVHLLDYVRPDIMLLRTVAANLIMWDGIQGTFEWIRGKLRPFHREMWQMTGLKRLDSDDLAFYNVIAGLCFSIALKHAGSGNEAVRDVLIHYLDQFIRLCCLPAINHDQRLTRTTLRNCQDLLSLSTALVMSGTGDIPVFRRLRRLHARLESDVPYGSHLATHLAIGVLFLGNGAFTFGTENIAVASLLLAFYPLFPSAPLDNKAHLQAFRHFWVLAVENRCIVPRDVETFRPTQIPINITLRDGSEINTLAPCLLPELKNVASITTTSPQHWTVVLDFMNSSIHRLAFERSQSIFITRRSAHASQSTVFQATLQALDEVENLKAPMEWLGGLAAFAKLEKAEKGLMIRSGGREEAECVDERLELECAVRDATNRTRLRGVELVGWGMMARGEEGGLGGNRGIGGAGLWVGEEVGEGLRASVWVRGGG